MYRANGGIVNPAAGLLPDQINLVHHLEAVAEQSHLATLVVVPTHRNLFQVQTRAKGEIEKLHVKPEPVDCRCFDQRAAHAHSKRFEPALRVPERHSRGEAYDEIEDASTLLATP